MSIDDRFAAIVEALRGVEGVTVGSGKRGFGSDALQVNGQIFAMARRGGLVLKLPSERVADIVASGVGTPFDGGKGRPVKQWVVVTDGTDERWLQLAEDALTFVGGRAT